MEIFFCFQNWLSLVIFITKYGVISAKERAHTNKEKRISSLEATKMKLEGSFFVKILLFIKRTVFQPKIEVLTIVHCKKLKN
jgi:hypothetical protein